MALPHGAVGWAAVSDFQIILTYFLRFLNSIGWTTLFYFKVLDHKCKYLERSGSVVECLTRDRRAAGSSLTGVTALWFLSKTHLS